MFLGSDIDNDKNHIFSLDNEKTGLFTGKSKIQGGYYRIISCSFLIMYG
jgi:hypothetical protein